MTPIIKIYIVVDRKKIDVPDSLATYTRDDLVKAFSSKAVADGFAASLNAHRPHHDGRYRVIGPVDLV